MLALEREAAHRCSCIEHDNPVTAPEAIFCDEELIPRLAGNTKVCIDTFV